MWKRKLQLQQYGQIHKKSGTKEDIHYDAIQVTCKITMLLEVRLIVNFWNVNKNEQKESFQGADILFLDLGWLHR